METLESLRRKIDSAGEISSVVRSMKAMAASNIGQYNRAATSLQEYFHTIELALLACQIQGGFLPSAYPQEKSMTAGVLVFGSGQGLAGRFNESLAEFVIARYPITGKNIRVWTMGEIMQDTLSDFNLQVSKSFSVPNTVRAITPFVAGVLEEIEAVQEDAGNWYLYYNRSESGAGYDPVQQRLIPPETSWMQNPGIQKWPGREIPEVVGNIKHAFPAFIREYLFMSLFRACAASLAAENAARLESMDRAKKNIDRMQDDLQHAYHRLRQETIDEELFDVVSGFEALRYPKRAR